MKAPAIYILILFAIVLSGCAELSKTVINELSSGIVETDSYYEITAIGAANAGEDVSEAQARVNSGRIAYILAVEILSEVIQGMAINGEVTIRDLDSGDGKITQIINANLSGVRELGVEYVQMSDGSWLAASTIRYEKSTLSSLIQNPSIIDFSNSDSIDPYTGILIDLRYFPGRSILFSPRIVDKDSVSIVTSRDLPVELFSRLGGFPLFTKILDSVSSENGAGDRPIVIVPDAINKEKQLIILSQKDIKRIRAFKQNNELKIAFIV